MSLRRRNTTFESAAAIVTSDPILELLDVSKHFSVRHGAVTLRAVDGVNLTVRPAETLALVGESGCGKSTTGKLIVRLLKPTSGKIVFCGQDISEASGRSLRQMRRELQIVFQDPFSSLNPRLTVQEIIAEPFRIHRLYGSRERNERIGELLHLVGLAAQHGQRYAHEFSGGQRQRIAIARAIALEPKLIVLDEPVSALDVSVQAQIINLLEELQERLGLAYIFISHDLSVVRHIADRVAVMYFGRVVELGDGDDIFESASHPYTQALLSAAPVADPRARDEKARIRLRGELPGPSDQLYAGCTFRTRCWLAVERCAMEVPSLSREYGSPHPSACFLPEPRDSVGGAS